MEHIEITEMEIYFSVVDVSMEGALQKGWSVVALDEDLIAKMFLIGQDKITQLEIAKRRFGRYKKRHAKAFKRFKKRAKKW